jgi:preprotein translocase subunit SecA
MKAATRLSAPGIVLGSYPERREPALSSPWMRGAAAFFARCGLPGQGVDRALVTTIRGIEQEIARQSDETLQRRTLALRAQLARSGFADAPVAETLAIAAVRCGRILGSVPYDTQLIAARIMLDGQLAEMATGEGKTLAVALTAATAALAGIPVHVVTANDYLVKRDAATLRPLFDALGLTVGEILPEQDLSIRRAAYACDIAYCTAKELVFDYLRDRVAQPRRHELEERAARLARPGAPRRLLRGLCMAIIDEADSVLIDEARMPLVLSQPARNRESAPFTHAWRLSMELRPGGDFTVDSGTRSARLTESGRDRLHARAKAGAFQWPTQRHCEDVVSVALAARHLLQPGRDYLVKDAAVHIIDPTTGRTAHGRSWAQGLHQLVEIKEGLDPGPQPEPLVQITYQRFFPRYLRLCGVSGTLVECRDELARIYGRQVITVPLRGPNRRKRLPPRAFTRQEAQRNAVVARVGELHARGQPILVGTSSVTESEALSRLLAAAGLRHAVLNARQDRKEAQIIAAAGSRGAITVATNMAGRGTDIILGPESAEAGGLHVICCQQNAARRIDRQMVGRSARQGDPGSAEMYIALDGPLLAHHWLARLLRICTVGAEMRHSWLGVLALRLAQRAKESSEKTQRKLLLRREAETDDWLAFSGREN